MRVAMDADAMVSATEGPRGKSAENRPLKRFSISRKYERNWDD
jgi:hypothetical protein